MIKYFLAAVATTLLVTACISSDQEATGKASTAATPTSPPAARTRLAASGPAEIPADIRFPSAVGEVIFRHQAHLKDRAIKCAQCHHQINARELSTPHPDYLQSSWINCKICHDGAGKARQRVYACSECHPTNPIHIADETLSAKVVIHKQCWQCHPVGTGKEAGTGCAKCHSEKQAS